MHPPWNCRWGGGAGQGQGQGPSRREGDETEKKEREPCLAPCLAAAYLLCFVSQPVPLLRTAVLFCSMIIVSLYFFLFPINPHHSSPPLPITPTLLSLTHSLLSFATLTFAPSPTFSLSYSTHPRVYMSAHSSSLCTIPLSLNSSLPPIIIAAHISFLDPVDLPLSLSSCVCDPSSSFSSFKHLLSPSFEQYQCRHQLLF